jgi:23S rRNA (pseudouridine1915-N3)-methyltransferase
MIKIICVGKLKEQYMVNMIEDYSKRINKYHHLIVEEIPDLNPKDEGKIIINKLDVKGIKVALTINGDKYNSIEFAEFIDKSLMNYSNIIFIIGGSDGLSDDVLKVIDKKVSFSELTFPHGLFRGILLEQIYRSFKILNNETYHK